MFKQLKFLKQNCQLSSFPHIKSQLLIWATQSSTPPPSDASPSSPSILLFGFAGSSPHQLAKQAAVYSSLGYTSLSTTLPAQISFAYDITQVSV